MNNSHPLRKLMKLRSPLSQESIRLVDSLHFHQTPQQPSSVHPSICQSSLAQAQNCGKSRTQRVRLVVANKNNRRIQGNNILSTGKSSNSSSSSRVIASFASFVASAVDLSLLEAFVVGRAPEAGAADMMMDV